MQLIAHATIDCMSDEKMTQNESFERTARELGVDLDETKLAETLRRVAKPDPEKKSCPAGVFSFC